MQSCGDPHVATLETFYARVMQRVCSAYCEESELPAEEAAKLLQQKWKQKLQLYTGTQRRPSAAAEGNGLSVVETARHSDIEAAGEEDSLSSSSSSSSEEEAEAATAQVIGRPSAQLQSTAATSTASSMFARMLGGKRKLQQLDGAAFDEEDAVEWQDAADRELQDLQGQSPVAREVLPTVALDTEHGGDDISSSNDTHETLELYQPSSADEEEKDAEMQQDSEELPSSRAYSTAPASLLVSVEDLAPVSGLSGSELPLQLAAEYTKFGHRGTRRGYVGELRAIVLTWPSRLGAWETVLPGELVWCYSDGSSGDGGLVKVLSLGDTIHELRVERSNGSVTTVQMDRVHRLKEYLIRKGSVRLQN